MAFHFAVFYDFFGDFFYSEQLLKAKRDILFWLVKAKVLG